MMPFTSADVFRLLVLKALYEPPREHALSSAGEPSVNHTLQLLQKAYLFEGPNSPAAAS